MFHDSRYGEECSHGHGWYLFDDGCAVTGCENAPGVGGGVPKQGLRDDALNRRLKRIADEMPALRDFIRAEHGPIGWEHTLSIWVTDLQKIVAERAALERPRPALPKPTAFCVQCGFAQMDTTRVLDGQTIPAPWQVDQCGAAWSDVYNAANSVCANWLTEGHATPQLSRHLQTLSTALMILDQKRVTGPVPMDGDTFTWKERADKAEAELARLRGAALPPQTGNPPPDATNFGLLTCALELLVANEREYAPSNAATDWYLRDQRVITLLREVLVRGNL